MGEERQFRGQVSYILNRGSFTDPEIIDGTGWFTQGTLVNRLPSPFREPMRARPKHIVINYTFSAGSSTISKSGIRATYLKGRVPTSVHFVVYKDGVVDQFVPIRDVAWAIGNGNRRGISNRNVISLQLDNAGVLKPFQNGSWSTLEGGLTIPNERVLAEKGFGRLSRDLLDDRNCGFGPAPNAGWDRFTLRQLTAAESLIDQVSAAITLRPDKDSVVALNELQCHKFAPGPLLNPWLKCLKRRITAGHSVGGCAQETVLDVAIPD
jgi:N-acetylmuramoyl-L-alanine amidase